LGGLVPDPGRTMPIEPKSKFSASQSQPRTWRSFVGYRPPIVIDAALGEHAAEFDLRGARRLALGFAATACRFRLLCRGARAIHFDLEDRHGESIRPQAVPVAWRIAACSRWAMSAPMASAWRSTALVMTSKPASSWSCVQPLLEARLTAHHRHHTAHPRRTMVSFTSNWRSRGSAPVGAVVRNVLPLTTFRPFCQSSTRGSQSPGEPTG
jgi:hypothetical protein